ncbi:MAG: heavy-metal-associated domain-containing protein [Bacteroidota bacterium]
MKKYELKIEGMSCGHCAMHVKKALEAIDGLEVETVEIGSARVWYDENAITQKQLQERIEEAGYTLVSVQ